MREAYGKLPLAFEQNRGQADGQVRFLSRGPGYSLFLTPREAVVSLTKSKPAPPQAPGRRSKTEEERAAAVVRMRMVGANPTPKMAGVSRLPGASNYLRGSDQSKWHTGVPNYARVKYREVYPGVDLLYHGRQGQLEYDFLVAPGADPKKIELAFRGQDGLALDRQGALVLRTDGGTLRQPRPVLYQEVGGQRRRVTGGYVLRDKQRVGFRIGAHDPARPLVIDPVLSYATYLGGSSRDSGNDIAVDSSGSAYITGVTSQGFPTANPRQPSSGGSTDAYVAKLNPSGSALVYSTYLGGRDGDAGIGIDVDSSGNAYVTGGTSSENFPTANPVQANNAGGDCQNMVCSDAFVAKLSATGSSLVYSTYLGGATERGGLETGNFGTEERGQGIAVDSAGRAHVTGTAFSDDFPTTARSVQPERSFGLCYGSALVTCPDAFVTKFASDGSSLLYSTFLGGREQDFGRRLALDADGNAYVTGWAGAGFPTKNPVQDYRGGDGDAFVTKVNPAGSALVYSTFLGGGSLDFGDDVAVDPSGNAHVTGTTHSEDLTTVKPIQAKYLEGPDDAFVSKLNSSGSAFVYSTYLGGTGTDHGNGIATDQSGNTYVTGDTSSRDFPTAKAMQSNNAGGSCSARHCPQDAFLTKLNASGSSLVHSTYLGGTGVDTGSQVAVDSSGSAYLTGDTDSSNFPTVNPIQATNSGGEISDVFVAKFAESPLPGPKPPLPGPKPPPLHQVTPTAPGDGGAQSGGVSGVDAGAEETRRARALRACLASAARHSRRERRLVRRGSVRRRAKAKRHLRRHRASLRRRCLRRHGRTPGRVAELRARAVSKTEAELSFLAPGSDRSRAPAARGYVVKQSRRPIRGRRGFRLAQTLCQGSCRFDVTRVGERLRLTIADLRPRTTYYYAVAARDNVSRRLGPRSRAVRVRTR